MVRILLIGDLHTPNRAKDCPEQIYSKLSELSEPEPFDYTLFTGDLIRFPEFLEFLDSKTKNKLFIVMGNMDYHYGNRDAPIYESVDIKFEDNDKMIVGLTHGAQISPRGDHKQLENLANKKNYNVIISGHTHKEEIFLSNGILLINPGSATGAWSFVASRIPSFIELDINVSTKAINVKLFQIDKETRDMIVFNSNFSFRNNLIIEKI
jgi:vacuolar protein sorting-associated protein 29